MSDLVQIAGSGLRGYQAALSVVGENIANAASPGYATRSVALQGVDPGSPGPLVQPGIGGLGVDIVGLKRAYDQFLATDARAAQSDAARLTGTKTWLTQIETALGSGTTSVGQGLTSFYNSAQALANEPGSSVERSAFLTAAGNAAANFRDTAAGLDQTAAALKTDIAGQVDTVNGLTAQLAALNSRLARATPDSDTSASLADQRDLLLTQLSRSIAIDVTAGARGVVAVRLGGPFGQQLVNGTTAIRLSAKATAVVLAKGGADVSAQVSGGGLAGSLAGVAQLGQTRAALDGLANDFAATVNAAHKTGVDLTGALGGALFATTTVAVGASPANNGAASVSTSLADGATPAATGYTLRYDSTAAAWTLARADGTASVTSPTALTLDGLTVNPAGQPADADLFTLTPRTGAAGLAVRINDPSKVATSDAWIAGPALGNLGSGTIAVITDPTAIVLPARPDYEVEFTDATHFEVLDPATATPTTPATVLLPAQLYTPGASIAGGGFNFTLTGTPATGDIFTVSAAGSAQGAASGDAGAIDRLLATRDAAVGTDTFENRSTTAANHVATALSTAKIAGTAATATLDTANAAVDTASGVNLDAQATDLVRFQQAYQASAKVIAAAQTLFSQLLQIN